MKFPQLVSHNLSGIVAPNVRIRLEFDTPLAPASVGMQSIMLTPQASFSLLKASYTYSTSGGHGVVEILPDYLLEAGVRYTLTITGKLTGEDGTAVAKQDLAFETKAPAVPTLDGGTAQILERAFTLKRAVPADGSYELNTDHGKGKITEKIVLILSDDVEPTQWPTTPASWNELPLVVEIGRIDGDPRYPVLVPQPEAVSVDGAVVTITLAKADGTLYNTAMDPEVPLSHTAVGMTFSPNTLVSLTLLPEIRTAYGTELGKTQNVTFSTELFPRYGTVMGLFWRWRHVTNVLDLSERELDYLIFEESRWLAAMQLSRDLQARIDLPRQVYFDYVRCKVLYQILSEAIAAQSIQGTIQDKQLGQFRITKNFASTPAPVTKLLDGFEQCWKNNLAVLLPVTTFTSAIRGLYSPYRRQMNPNAIAARRMDGHFSSAAPNPWARLNPHAHSPASLGGLSALGAAGAAMTGDVPLAGVIDAYDPRFS